MKHFFTQATTEASIWCQKCHKDTLWRIMGGRPAYCIDCQHKAENPNIPGDCRSRARTNRDVSQVRGPVKQEERLSAILRVMIRQEIDQTPGFRELASRDPLPRNEHAERTILGAVLLEGRIPDEAKGLLAEDFCLASHQRLWTGMLGLAAVDSVTLLESLKQDGCKEVGGYAYIAALTEGLPRHPVIGEYIRIVQEKAKLRRIWRACEAAIEKCKGQRANSGEIVSELGVDLKGMRGKVAK